MAEAQSPTEIRHHIEHQRADLAGNLQQLETTMKRSFDVRSLVQREPMTLALIALGSGIYLASRKSSRPVPEARELNETLSLTATALMTLGKKQLGGMVDGAKAGLGS